MSVVLKENLREVIEPTVHPRVHRSDFTSCEHFWWLNDFRCIESCGSGLAS